MYKIATPLFIQCLTPTHVGSGSDIGIVDLPIQREGHTNYPKFEASSLKGALRQRFESIAADDLDKEKIHLVFGYDPQHEDKTFKTNFEKKYDKEYMGALGLTNARLLFFPVKSMKGVYALITSQGILEKFVSEMDMCDLLGDFKTNLALLKTEVKKLNLTTDGKCYAVNGKLVSTTEIILEEYVFEVDKNNAPNLTNIAVALKNLTGVDASKHLVILQDEDFRDFTELSTEIITRIKIKNSTGVVEGGALFTEEYLPAQSVLYSLVLSSPVFQTKQHPFSEKKGDKNAIPEEKAILSYFQTVLKAAKNTMQIGGNTTLGKGIVTINLLKT